jgi:hypothetical protein
MVVLTHDANDSMSQNKLFRRAQHKKRTQFSNQVSQGIHNLAVKTAIKLDLKHACPYGRVASEFKVGQQFFVVYHSDSTVFAPS